LKVIQGHRFWKKSPYATSYLVNNSNVNPISHRVQDIAEYWSNFRRRRRCLCL